MKNKKLTKILLLSIIVLGISIGFATLATTLKINGTSGIGKNTWNIYWDNVHNQSGVAPSVGPTISADEDNHPKTLVTWAVTLNNPGDYFEFEVDAVNAGTIDAMVTHVASYVGDDPLITIENGETLPVSPSPLPSYIKYSVTYPDGDPVQLGNLLAKADYSTTPATPTRKTYKIRVEYDQNAISIDDVNNMDNPETFDFSFEVTYGQADETARN